MMEMPQDPVYGSDPVDPHEPCEREIARLEAAQSISFAELHALVAGWLPGRTFFVSVIVQHAHDNWGARDIVTWRISYGYEREGTSWERLDLIEAATAAEALAKLRAAVPAPPLASVGDISW